MNPDGISLQFLAATQNILSDIIQSDGPAMFEPCLAEALADLERFSLIFRPDSNLIRIHRLVQSVIKDQMTMDELDKHQKLVCQVGLSAFPDFDYTMRTTCRKYEGEIVAIISEIAKIKSEDTARLMGRVGRYFWQDGKASEAAPLLSSACNAFKIAKGGDDLDTLWTMGNLAVSYKLLGKVKEAAGMEEKVWEARRRILGEEHPDTLLTTGNLANSYRSMGNVKEAAEIEEKVLKVRTRLLREVRAEQEK